MAQEKPEELTAVYESEYRRKDGWCVIYLEGNIFANGNAAIGELVPGVTYTFMGNWTEWNGVKQFKFRSYIQSTPHSRRGLVLYLNKFAPNIGVVTANRLIDMYGEADCLGILKSDPSRVARETRLTIAQATKAAELLISIEGVQETKIKLMALFDSSGLYSQGIELAIKLWGVNAPRKITNDPFSLLWHRFPGAGFSRVDKLYQSLGHPSDRCKRQVYCAVDTVDKDDTGSTWVPFSEIERRINDLVTGNVNPQKACKIAVRCKLLSVIHQDGQDWYALRRIADAEAYTLNRIKLLLGDVGQWYQPEENQESTVSETSSTVIKSTASRNISYTPSERRFAEILDF